MNAQQNKKKLPIAWEFFISYLVRNIAIFQLPVDDFVVM
jgi:hypothetical protein